MLFSNDIFFNNLQNIKPCIAISACLLGENVRYNGENKLFPHITGFFTEKAILTPICPEVGAGLSVPRPPVQLVENNDEIKVLGVEDNSLEVTHALTAYSENYCLKHAGDFEAVILKARSPSCGIHSTPVFHPENRVIRYGGGVFGNTARRLWSNALFAEEEDLQTEKQRMDFLLHCYMLLDIRLSGNSESQTLLAHYNRHHFQAGSVDQLKRTIVQSFSFA